MLAMSVERRLAAYGDLAVGVALNLQPRQRLLIVGPLMHGGVSLEAAPLVRQIAASAYRAGATLVEAVWGDEPLQLVRFRTASRDTFGAFSTWLPHVLTNHVANGGAILSIHANDPGLLRDEPPDLTETLRNVVSRRFQEFRDQKQRNLTNWSMIAAPSAGWAATLFPDAAEDERGCRLWDAIARVCRLDDPAPVDAWQQHLSALAARAEALNQRRFSALRFVGPDTDLTVGLPDAHVWVTGAMTSQSGIRFVANLPTEEVFTAVDRDRVSGCVRSTKPLVVGGTVINDFRLRFEAGRVVDVRAAHGESALQQLVRGSAASDRLGEVALVADSSPVSRAGLLFYNGLLDENAASHLALGSSYPFTLQNGSDMDDDAFLRAGGNRSDIHVDFMIGSPAVNVDGVTGEGATEPLMRCGEWAHG